MVSEYDIKARSYLLWEAAGRPQGRDREFWFEAEAGLRAESRETRRMPTPALFLVPNVPSFRPLQRRTAIRISTHGRKTA